MEETLETAMKVVSEWQSYDTSSDYCPNTSLFDHHSHNEFIQFMHAVKDLQSAIVCLNSSSSSTSSKKLTSAQNLLRTTMKRLSKELSSILKNIKPEHLLAIHHSHRHHHHHHQHDEITSSELVVFTSHRYETDGVLGETTMDDLKLISGCMMSSGYGKKCLKVYKLTRRSIVEDAIHKLGGRKLKKAQVQKMDWETVESKMKEWSDGISIAVKQIFLSEKILCDHLFSSSYSLPPAKDLCFADVCKDIAITLFRIPGKLAKHSKRLSERLFPYLDLYDAISEVLPDIELIFSSDLTAPARAQASSSMARITDAVRTMLMDFEAYVQKDASKALVVGGGVHSLTRHVMTYLNSLVDYTPALEKILADCPISLQSPLPEKFLEGETASSPVVLRFSWLILVLMCKLDAKSENYKDPSLSFLFLANNLRFVVSNVKGSKLRSILGEKWVASHTNKVLQYAANYEKMGWGKVICALPEDPTADIPLDQVKECFRKFNAEFGEEYRKQVDWIVLDDKLRDRIKASIARKVGKRYRGMYDKYNEALVKSRERGVLETVVKFTPDDLDNFLSELLDGPDSETTGEILPVTGEDTGASEHGGTQRRRKRLLLLIRQQIS